MNAPLRRVGVVLMVMFGLLFANLNWVQAYKADEYRNSPYNAGRVQIEEYQRERGRIIAAGEALAVSVETGGRLTYLRTYPEDDLWAHVVGYKPVNIGPTGIELFENEFLAGTGDRFFVDRVRDLFTGGSTAGGNVVTTLSRPGQETAYAELRGNAVGASRGSVVAINPRTGAVQVMVSMPAFDPNPLASHDPAEAQAAYDELNADPQRPLLNRVTAERYPPGSVFKVIDSAAALMNGLTPDSTLAGGAEYLPPTAGQPVRNAPGVVCPNEITLRQALVVSCNTAFSHLMAEELGGDVLAETAAAFGVGEELTVGQLDEDGIPVAPSQVGDLKRPDGQDDPPTVAQSAIGQANVALTPLQAVLIPAAVVNDGVQMRPYLVQELQAPDLRPLYTASPQELRRAIPGEVAAALQDMMVGVVAEGTGRNAQIAGAVVGGKTGTAETGDQPEHGWFVGFAIVDGTPVTAVAVMLENAGNGGSAEATRIAGAVMRAVIEDQGGG